MSRVKYSKKRMIGQSRTKSLKYMAPLKPGTVLNIEDLIQDTIEREGSQDIMNDQIICHDEDGQVIKVPVREFAKMESVAGSAWDSEGDSDEILLPESLVVVSSENRRYTPQGGEEQDLFPTYAYNKAEEFLNSAGQMPFDELVNSGVKEDHGFSPVQNYTVEFK